MKNFVKRCEADPWVRIPGFVVSICLVLMLITPEPWQTWAVYVGFASIVVSLVCMVRHVGQGHTESEDAVRPHPIFDVIQNVLGIVWFVLVFVVLIWIVWIAPLLK
ncbi:MAG: hypothetical protein IJB62_07795 [Alistipes sp.]|nr:hypothetical protein [Alistipes sp.]